MINLYVTEDREFIRQMQELLPNRGYKLFLSMGIVDDDYVLQPFFLFRLFMLLWRCHTFVTYLSHAIFWRER